MILNLGVIKNPDNYLNREFEVLSSVDINLKSNVDIVSPELYLSKIEGVNLKNISYAHIPELNRYYFVTSIESVNNKIDRVSLHCDVIYTYREQILNSVASFNRAIKSGDYITANIDYSVIKNIETRTSGIKLGNHNTLILSTVGGNK